MTDLDKVIAAQKRFKETQRRFDLALENLPEIHAAHLEAAEADLKWRQELADFVRHNGRCIVDDALGPWIRLHLKETLGWTQEQISELEELYR